MKQVLTQALVTVVLGAAVLAAPAAARGAAGPTGPTAGADSAATPAVHSISVGGDGVSMYPAVSPDVHHYGIRTTGSTGGSVIVTATTSDPTGTLTVDGHTPDAGGAVLLTGLTSGHQILVQVDDDLGRTIDSLIFLPSDFPELVATTTGTPEQGDVFVNVGGYATAVDQNAVPIFLMSDVGGGDFKQQPNGNYSTTLPANDPAAGYTITELNRQFQSVASHAALAPLVNTDSHDSILEVNGNQVTVSYEPSGTRTDAVIQEADPAGHVLFTWNSHDHGFRVSDAYVVGSAPLADYMHINSIQITPHGDFLASFRNLSAIVKIARTAHDGFAAGDVMWQLGGKHNQFTFVDDPLDGPCAQHTAYEQPDGHLTFFDDGAQANPALGSETADMCPDPAAADPNTIRIARPHSRAVEYAINETTHTATLVWSYDRPDIFTAFAGSTQRLANGDTLVDWAFNGAVGTSIPIATEVNAAKNVVWQLTTPGFAFSYRAFKFPSNDDEAPTVTVTTPREGATYPPGAHAALDCADAGGSLLETCRGSVPAGSPISSALGPHTFVVTATDHAGNRTVVTRHYVVAVAPSAPGSLAAAAGRNAVALHWMAPTSFGGTPLKSYRVWRATAGQPWATIKYTTLTSYVSPGLKAGVTYYFRVEALTRAGTSRPSAPSHAVPFTYASAPRSLVAAPGQHTVALHWSPPASLGSTPLESYRVSRTTAGRPWATIKYTTLTSYVSPGLTPGVRYYFKVEALNRAGVSPPSTTVVAVPR